MAGSSRKSIGLNLALTLMAWGFISSSYASESDVRYKVDSIPSNADNAFGSIASACTSSFARSVMNSTLPATMHSPQLTGQYVDVAGKKSCSIRVTTYRDNNPSNPAQTAVISGFVYISTISGCLLTQGQTQEFKGPESPIIWSGTSGYVSWQSNPDSETCYRACQYLGQSKTSCYLSKESSDSGFCNYFAGSTGEVCDMQSADVASSGSPIVRPDPSPDPDPDPDPDPGDGGGDGGGGGGGGGSSGSPVTPPDPVDVSNPNAATTGDVADLGNRLVEATYATANGIISAINGLGSKVDGVGKKVDGIGDKIDDLGDSLQGEPYSEGEGEGAGNADGIGDEAGDSLADLINSAVDEAKQARTDSFNEEVDKVDGMLSEWFGEDASGVGGAILDGLFPKSSSCSEFNVVWHAKGYSLTLPICELTRVKSILEWVFGILTAIAVWRILMNTLNQAAASAVRYS